MKIVVLKYQTQIMESESKKISIFGPIFQIFKLQYLENFLIDLKFRVTFRISESWAFIRYPEYSVKFKNWTLCQFSQEGPKNRFFAVFSNIIKNEIQQLGDEEKENFQKFGEFYSSSIIEEINLFHFNFSQKYVLLSLRDTESQCMPTLRELIHDWSHPFNIISYK